MKKKNFLLTLVSVFLLSAMLMTSAVAQTRTVGVDPGDWFKYGDITGSWSSDDPNATIPSFAFNETEWLLLSVGVVSGTNVTGQMTIRYKNGTEESDEGWIDIDTGEGKEGALWIISANLDAGHTLYTSGNYSTWTINETISRTYLGGVRNTNHLNITAEYSMGIFYQYFSMNYYWDRSSGILVELSQEWVLQVDVNITSWAFTIKITESNVWIVPEFPTWTFMMLILIVLTAAIAIYKRKPLKTIIH